MRETLDAEVPDNEEEKSSAGIWGEGKRFVRVVRIPRPELGSGQDRPVPLSVAGQILQSRNCETLFL